MKKLQHLKRIIIASGALAFALGAQAQTSSLLWKVSAKDVAKPTYLFGTIHALPQDKFFYPEALSETLAASDKLVLEFDMDDPKEMSSLQSLVMMKDNKNIKDFMTADQVETVSKYFADSVGIPFDQIATLKPFVFSSLLLKKIVGTSFTGYEMMFITDAKKQGKTVDGLETAAEQIGYFDLIPIDIQVKQLAEQIADMSKQRDSYKKMLDSFLKQDIKSLNQLVVDETKEFPLFSKVIITDRNKAWIPRIEKIVNEGGAFIAVGAGHLAGDEGVIELLKKKGFTVEPVTIK